MPNADDSPPHGLTAPLRVLRISQWAHFVFLPFAPLSRDELFSVRGAGRVSCAMLSTAAALGYAYAVNAIGDRSSDMMASKNPLVGVAHVPQSVSLVTLGAALLSMAAALPLGWLAATCAGVSLLAATVYSVGPRAKAYPVLGLVANTMIFVPLLFYLMSTVRPGFVALVATFVGLLVQNQLVHELSDADEDVAGGDRTTSAVLGASGARFVCVVVALAGASYVFRVTHDVSVSALATIALFVGAGVVIGVADPHRARRVHRHVSALGGAVMYLVGLLR